MRKQIGTGIIGDFEINELSLTLTRDAAQQQFSYQLSVYHVMLKFLLHLIILLHRIL